MENASKALLMAGGILVAIIIIGLLVRTFSNLSEFQMSRLSEEEQEQLVAFNESYTKYLNQYIYGVEVASLINKWKNDGLVYVNVLPDESGLPSDAGQGKITYYKCTGITYDNSTGMVNTITFEKIDVKSPWEE